MAEGKQSAPEASKCLGTGESTLYKWTDQLKPIDEKGSKNIKGNDEQVRIRGELVELGSAKTWHTHLAYSVLELKELTGIYIKFKL